MRPRVKLLEPVYNSPRLLAQDGAFTVQADPWIPMDHYAGTQFWNTDLDVSGLFCWEIAREKKRLLMEQLSGLGITHRAVYPDLDGIARSLWETDVLRNGQGNGEKV